MIDQLREDLRFVADRLDWPRDRVLEVGRAVSRAIEAGDQGAIRSFALEYAARRKAVSEAARPISPREAMPAVAALVDEYQAVFGDIKVTFAMEAGRVAGRRQLSDNEVAASDMVIRPPEAEEAMVRRAMKR